jgi:hypothetical protein
MTTQYESIAKDMVMLSHLLFSESLFAFSKMNFKNSKLNNW